MGVQIIFNSSYIRDDSVLLLDDDKLYFCHCRVYHIAKLYFCYAVLVTYALVFYVPLDFMEPLLFKRLKTDKNKQPKRTCVIQLIFRSFFVLITGEVT